MEVSGWTTVRGERGEEEEEGQEERGRELVDGWVSNQIAWKRQSGRSEENATYFPPSVRRFSTLTSCLSLSIPPSLAGSVPTCLPTNLHTHLQGCDTPPLTHTDWHTHKHQAESFITLCHTHKHTDSHTQQYRDGWVSGLGPSTCKAATHLH